MKVGLPSFLTQDLARKVVALFFATLIWLAIDSQLHDFVVLHNVPVTLRHDRSAMILEDDRALTVDVTLRGPRKRLQRLNTGDIKINATVPTVPRGIYFYDLRVSPANVMAPMGTRVTEIAPEQQQLRVDRIVAKGNVPIRVRFSGTLREGYKKTRCSSFPTAIDIRGPSRLLKDIKELVTEPVPLDESITQDFEIDVKLVPIPGVAATNTDVHVSIEIAKHSSQQAYRDLELNVLCRADSGLVLAEPPPPVAVTVHGPKVTLDALDRLSVRPFVDLTAITNPGRFRRPVQVWIDGAANVTAEYVHPSMIEILLVPGSERAPLSTPASKTKKATPAGTAAEGAPAPREEE